MITRTFPELDSAVNSDAWDYLQDTAPTYAAAVGQAVKSGGKPDEIYRYILDRVGMHREAMALRCRQAAQFLIDNKDGG